MKYANIIWQNTEIENSTYKSVNIGDCLQFLIIEYIYKRMNIDSHEIVRLSMKDIRGYKGEKLILPLNWSLFDINFMDENKINISNDIIPVFCAMTIESHTYKEDYLNEYNIRFLKKYEPIGCRDYKTYSALKKVGIKAYLNGCLTSIFSSRSKEGKHDKILLVDAPLELYSYIPNEMIKGAISLTQQYYYKNDISAYSIMENVKQQYKFYCDEAKLVITSRLHVASPCMAMGIPVIFVKDSIDARFSWINIYLKLYSRNEFQNIDWNPGRIEFEENKSMILELVCKRIRGERIKEDEYLRVHNLYKKCGNNNISFQTTVHSNFSKIIDFFKEEKYDSGSEFNYGIWGLGAAAENFYNFMEKNYPKATLVTALDTYKSAIFHGVKSETPDKYIRNKSEIMFVLTVQASNIAKDILLKKGFNTSEFVCSGDQFIQQNCLRFDKN